MCQDNAQWRRATERRDRDLPRAFGAIHLEPRREAMQRWRDVRKCDPSCAARSVCLCSALRWRRAKGQEAMRLLGESDGGRELQAMQPLQRQARMQTRGQRLWISGGDRCGARQQSATKNMVVGSVAVPRSFLTVPGLVHVVRQSVRARNACADGDAAPPVTRCSCRAVAGTAP